MFKFLQDKINSYMNGSYKNHNEKQFLHKTIQQEIYPHINRYLYYNGLI